MAERSTLIFNGIVSSDKDIYVKTFPEYTIPEENVEVISIPGKNGDVIIPSGSYKNVEMKYELNVSINNSFYDSLQSIIDWLQPHDSGYHVLKDSNDTNHFRYARLKNSVKLANIHNKAASFEAIFDCKPQRYKEPEFVSGSEFIPFSSESSYFINPYHFLAKPIFKVVPPSTIVSGSQQVNIAITHYPDPSDLTHFTVETMFQIIFPTSWTGSAVYVDYETENAYTIDSDGNKHNVNDMVSMQADKFTGLTYGLNSPTSVGSGFTASMYPRWWTL